MSTRRDKIYKRAKAHARKAAQDDVLDGRDACEASWVSGYYACLQDVRKAAVLKDGQEYSRAASGTQVIQWLEEQP